MRALYVGLISGTSMDGVDAALVEFEGARFSGLLATASATYDVALRTRLLKLQRDEPAISLRELAELDVAVASTFVTAAQRLLADTKLSATAVSAIGSHGQTVFHDPRGVGSSLQLGDPNLIAARCGITTVADFRRRDIACGGEGAPLVPAFHQAAFGNAHEIRCVVNIGGIANITYIPSDGAAVIGFDTGPGNGLMDEWVFRQRGAAYDANGDYAASGTVSTALLDALLADPYFSRSAPKSTGRGDFNLDWVQRIFPALGALAPADVQRTLGELSARSIIDAVRAHAPGTRRLLVCGGGARNGWLMQRLTELCALPTTATDAEGLAAEWVEACAFAWLAMRTVNNLPGNLPSVTGARAACILGGIYRA